MIKKHKLVFLAITILALSFFFIEDYFKSPQKTPYYKEKMAAAELAALAMKTLKEEVLRRHIPLDSINDPNGTYLVGNRFSIITANQNSHTDVLTTLNPNFAAGILELFKKLKLTDGDIIAINTTGSFPGLNIALLSACEIIGLKPVITTAVSSASYGANIPEFTYLDMETFLQKEGIFHNRTYAASLGGERDNGEGISPAGRELLMEAIKRNNVKLINRGSLADNIEERYEIFESFLKDNKKGLKVFIDVGGTITGFAQSVIDTLVKPGINIYPEYQSFSNYGLVHQMLEERIPFIFLGDIQNLAMSLRLSVSPIPQPLPGEDPLFYEERYSVKLAVLFLVCLLGLLFLYIRIEIYLRKK
ncbi:MAG: poly-gamma-glutamate system protein [Candidatus Cloacimonadota bacterium]|nr:MAG: poly-gamma-glutamate system protein [Candidatus Cloacimonadota bacterium]